MDVYLAYLRKSRKDAELEAQGAGETLARHRKILQDLAAHYGYSVVKTYEEVVSGDSISDRPEMQKLLKEVETGLYAGVLVVEVERLSRGDGIDQAIVSKTFQYTNTKIITPTKIYDPSNEMDNEYFEFGLFMSRREYNTIKRRLKRGKEAAAREGKWSNGFAPYGYQTVKVPGQKGLTLAPTEKAEIVRMIYQLYVGGESLADIADALNGMGVPTPSEKNVWAKTGVADIIKNPVYAGYIRSHNSRMEKRIVGGEIVERRVKCSEDEKTIVKGLHPPIVSEDVFQKANERLAVKCCRKPNRYQLRNPFSTVLRCGACGYAMSGRQYENGGGYVSCPHCRRYVGASIREVEKAVLPALKEWVKDLPTAQGESSTSDRKTEQYDRLVSQKEAEIERLDAQMKRAYELVEQGVYTIDIFRERAKAIKDGRTAAEKALRAAKKEAAAYDAAMRKRKDILPVARTLVDAYGNAKTPDEKNRLLRSIVARIDYAKTSHTKSKEGSDMTLTIHPLFFV